MQFQGIPAVRHSFIESGDRLLHVMHAGKATLNLLLSMGLSTAMS